MTPTSPAARFRAAPLRSASLCRGRLLRLGTLVWATLLFTAVRAQTANLPTNVGINMQQITSANANDPTPGATNDGATNSTALNYNFSRDDLYDNEIAGADKINRSLTASANLAYNGTTTFTGALNAYGSRADGSKHLSGNVFASNAGTISFTINASAPYTLSGSFLATITSGSPQVLGQLTLTTSGGATVFNENYSTTTSVNTPFANNLTGTLAPGNYTLQFVDESLFTAGNGAVTAGQLQYTFEVGVVPEPSTWLGGALLAAGTALTLRRRGRAV